MSKNKKQICWLVLGTMFTFISGLLLPLIYQMMTWAPTLVEIASVTWNDAPGV
jgi:hypothetical protein